MSVSFNLISQCNEAYFRYVVVTFRFFNWLNLKYLDMNSIVVYLFGLLNFLRCAMRPWTEKKRENKFQVFSISLGFGVPWKLYNNNQLIDPVQAYVCVSSFLPVRIFHFIFYFSQIHIILRAPFYICFHIERMRMDSKQFCIFFIR